MRGIASIAKLVTPASASARTVSPAVSGARKPISTEPRPRRPISSADGGATLATTSPVQPSPSLAPALSYSASRWCAPAPAPASTVTSMSLRLSRSTTSGTSATRRSPLAVSLGTETFMNARPGVGGAACYLLATRVGSQSCDSACSLPLWRCSQRAPAALRPPARPLPPCPPARWEARRPTWTASSPPGWRRRSGASAAARRGSARSPRAWRPTSTAWRRCRCARPRSASPRTRWSASPR